jgi:hypothetical protein
MLMVRVASGNLSPVVSDARTRLRAAFSNAALIEAG